MWKAWTGSNFWSFNEVMGTADEIFDVQNCLYGRTAGGNSKSDCLFTDSSRPHLLQDPINTPLKCQIHTKPNVEALKIPRRTYKLLKINFGSCRSKATRKYQTLIDEDFKWNGERISHVHKFNDYVTNRGYRAASARFPRKYCSTVAACSCIKIKWNYHLWQKATSINVNESKRYERSDGYRNMSEQMIIWKTPGMYMAASLLQHKKL